MSQMYDWTSGDKGTTWNPLGGECHHNCTYCYRKTMMDKFPQLNDKYSGHPKIYERELKKRFKSNQTVFVCSMTDLFAENIPSKFITDILRVTRKFPDTTFLFQSKNPCRFGDFEWFFPPRTILGTTIETDNYPEARISTAMKPKLRALCMSNIRGTKMISIEPIMKFDHDKFMDLIKKAGPDFVSIGADSKNNGLIEPTKDEILRLIDSIKGLGIEVRLKSNLNRLLNR